MGSSPSISTSASSVGLKRSKKTGVWHKCHSLFSCLALCLALRSVTISGNEIVTAHAVRLFRRCAPYEPLYLYQRFERRLEAIQKNGSLAQVPLPFFLPRPLPCSPLRDDIGKRNCDARQASLFRHYAIASFLTAIREAAAFAKLLPFYNRCIYCEAKPLYQRFERRLEAIQKNGSLAQVPLPLFCVKFVNKISYTPLPRQTFYFCARMPYNLYGYRRNICERLRSSPLWVRRVRTKTF